MRALPLLLVVLLVAVPVSAAIAPGDVGSVATPDVTDADGTSATVQEDGTDDDGETDGADESDGTNETDGTDESDGTNETDGEGDERVRVLTSPADRAPTVSIGLHGADVGPATGLDVSAMTAAMETESIVAHVESAETNDERQRRLLTAESELRQDELSLHSRQREAIRAHATGQMTDEALIAELARIAVTAEALDERRERLVDLADETDDFSLSTAEIQLRLSVYSGPVRTYATDALYGDTAADRIYVETNDDTLVLTAVIGDDYVREVYRGDRWDRGASSFGENPGDEAINATSAAYAGGVNTDSTSTLESSSLIRVDVPFTRDRGDLRTYVSAGEGDVFVEHQHRPLDAFDEAESVSVTQDGFTLTVNRTYPGGPVKVTVLDAEDGDPVRGVTVTIATGGTESEEVGTTDADGVLWTLSPSQSYQVTAVEEPQVARITGIEPTPTPRVEEPTDDG